MSELDNYKHLIKNNKNIPDEYKSCSLHIALERADNNKDWIGLYLKKYIKYLLNILKIIYE